MRMWRGRPRIREGVVGALVGLACVALSYRMQGMHRGDFSLPDRDGDTLGIYMLVKGMQQHGWYTPNPSLGYPSGQDLAPYPNLDLLHLITLKVCSLFFSNPFGPVRLFDFWAFFVIGALGYVLLRYAGVRMLIAAPLAVTISLAPWHFQRLTGHIFLANYSSLIVALLMALFCLRRVRAAIDDPGLRRADIPAVAGLVIGGFYIAGGGLYWLFGGGIVIALTVLPALVTHRTWRGALYTAATLVPAPVFALIWLKGQTALASYPLIVRSFTRQLNESELYGGSISALFFASPRSGIHHLASARGTYDGWTLIARNWESGPWNGAVGILAVTAALAVALGAMSTLWPERQPGRVVEALRRTVDAPRRDGWLALFIVALLMYAVTGLGILTMTYVTMDIRAWGRFFILVVIIATVILGLALTALTRTVRAPWLAVVVAALLTTLFVADEVRGGGYRTDFVTISTIAGDAKAFDQTVEAFAPPGCPILDLPVLPFPENGPIGGMKDYDPLWLYLQSTDLRFTYGVPKFQPEATWQAQFAQPLTPELLDVARKAGICGIAIDTAAYGGPDQPDVMKMRYLVGGTPIQSPSRRWMFLRI